MNMHNEIDIQPVFQDTRYSQIGFDLLKQIFSLKQVDRFNELAIPSFSLFNKEDDLFQVVMLAHKNDHTVKFCYEMFRKWAVPGRLISFSHFAAFDFDFEATSYSVIDIGFSLTPFLASQFLDHLPLIQEEVCLGLSSSYQASKLLEIKGMTSEEKFLHMQERIFCYLNRFSMLIDHDIVPFMQSIFFSLSENFKTLRSEHHLSKIILSLYFLEKNFHRREKICTRIRKAYIQDVFGAKEVVSIGICFQALSDADIFEKKNMFQFLTTYFPSIALLEESFFIKQTPSKDISYLYFELEKASGEKFSKRDLHFLEELVPISLQKSIHQFVKPIFIPRNEEELYKNMITLSSQLLHKKDLPQVMISYEQRLQDRWDFSVLIVCSAPQFIDQFEKKIVRNKVGLQLEKRKTIGMIRKKHPKEGLILRGSVYTDMLEDQLIDYYEARQKIAIEIRQIIGPFRDFNGGMIEKQMEKLEEIKKFIDTDQHTSNLIDTFFISIKQREYIAIWDTFLLVEFFYLFKQACNNIFSADQEWIEKELDGAWMGVGIFSDKKLYEKNAQMSAQMNIASHQYLSISLQHMQKYIYGLLIKHDFMELNELKTKLDML